MTALKPILIEIPPDVVDAARIPAGELLPTLKQELAVHLYARQILPKVAARRLAALDRLAFDQILGQRGIVTQLAPDDVDTDLAALRTAPHEVPRDSGLPE